MQAKVSSLLLYFSLVPSEAEGASAISILLPRCPLSTNHYPLITVPISFRSHSYEPRHSKSFISHSYEKHPGGGTQDQ
jgi:hypothetical protein